jgi:hypothetical protein
MNDPTLFHPLMLASIRQRVGEGDPWGDLETRVGPWLGAADRLLGHGGEGVVFAGDGLVSKYLLNWTHPRRIPGQTEAWLRDLASRIEGAVHLYPLTIARLDADLLRVSYRAEPGVPLAEPIVAHDWERIRPQLQACLSELTARGFGHTNARASNFVWDDGTLKLVDYGSDCRPLGDACEALARMQLMSAAGIYDWGDV